MIFFCLLMILVIIYLSSQFINNAEQIVLTQLYSIHIYNVLSPFSEFVSTNMIFVSREDNVNYSKFRVWAIDHNTIYERYIIKHDIKEILGIQLYPYFIQQDTIITTKSYSGSITEMLLENLIRYSNRNIISLWPK